MFVVLAVLLTLNLWLAPVTAQEYLHRGTLTGHTQVVRSVVFMGDTNLVSGGDDETLRAWNLRTEEQLWRANVGGQVFAVAIPLHQPFYTAYGGVYDYNIRLRYTPNGNWRGRITGHSETVRGLAFKPENHHLASGSEDNTIKIWNTDNNANLQLMRTLRGHTDSVLSVAWNHDGSVLASSGADGTVRLWNPTNGINYSVLRGHREEVLSIAWHPNGQMIASGSADNTIRIWDVNTERTLQTLQEHTNSILSIAWHPDGEMLVSGSADGTVRLWNPDTGENTASMIGHTGAVTSVVWSPNGRMFVSGSADRTIRIWEPLSMDVTGNGIVNINDLFAVVREYGTTVAEGANPRADVNADGRVDIEDIALVAKAVNPGFAAPPIVVPHPDLPFTVETVQAWIEDAKRNGIDPDGIAVLERLLAVLAHTETLPLKTAVFTNYPNPFNPETWIPYQLAAPTEVTVSIHSADGKLVRTLVLGHMPAGVYADKNRAAYWDGRNTQGEHVASGVYFYTLKAGDFTATRKMLTLK